MQLIVGLGNIGNQYLNTRHNIGFKLIDRLVQKTNAIDVSKGSFYGELYKSGSTLFLKPSTYMNLSGKSVLAVKNFYKIELENIIIIHDDIDLAFNALRFKVGGGHGGHNGLKSIDGVISKEYLRIRMGVGKPVHKSQVADYVLSDFTQDESSKLEDFFSHTLNALEALKTQELEKVKSLYSLKG